jgi:hypothetical protein
MLPARDTWFSKFIKLYNAHLALSIAALTED